MFEQIQLGLYVFVLATFIVEEKTAIAPSTVA